MAFGIIFIDMTPGYNVDLMSYLFGSILTVPRSDLNLMAVIGVIMTTAGFYYYQDLLAISDDEEYARIRGVPVKKLYFGLIGMLAVTIVMVIQVVGLILVIALLTIPSFIVEKYANSLIQMMVASSLLGAVFSVTGLWLSYRYDLISGASVIMASGSVFLISLMVDKIRVVSIKKG